jgi:hypothetical protein
MGLDSTEENLGRYLEILKARWHLRRLTLRC